MTKQTALFLLAALAFLLLGIYAMITQDATPLVGVITFGLGLFMDKPRLNGKGERSPPPKEPDDEEPEEG